MKRVAHRTPPVLFVLGFAACSNDAPPPEKASDAPPPAPSVFFAGRMRPVAPWAVELRKRIDPTVDGWPTEAVAEAAERALRPALEALLARGDTAPLTALFGDRPPALGMLPRPVDAQVVFDDGVVRVFHRDLAPPTAPDTHGDPKARLLEWRSEFAGRGPVRVELACELVVPEDGTFRAVFQTRVIVGPSPSGERVEDRFALVARIEPRTQDAPLRFVGLGAGMDVWRVLVRSRVLRGITRAVFGADPCFAEEILRGTEDYHLRQDRLSNQPVLGMHGLAVGDVDGDGLEDVYLPQPGGQANRLFVHAADGTARDTARAARVDFLENCGPALFVDLDGDGDQDLVVGTGPHLFVTWNDGHGNFPQGQVLQAPDEPEITTLAAADPDLDGDVDLFACRYVAGGMIGAAPAPYHNAHNGAPNLFWRNDGERKFAECARALGLESDPPRFTLAATWFDYDDDGDPDLYVVNDFGENQLLRNDRGKFVDVAAALGVTDTAAGMGVDVADADLDGRLDLYVTNMHSSAGLRIARQERYLAAHPELKPAYVRHARGNTLLRSRSDGTFEDVTESSGTGPAGWGWGARFFDLQNDALPDLWAPNGFVTNEKPGDLSSFFWRCVIARTSLAPPPEPDYVNAWTALRHFTTFEGGTYAGNERKCAFLNLGGLVFVEAAGALGADFLGDGRACAPLDWDDDGRVDLLLRDRTAPRLRLLRNEHAAAGHWIAFELAGTRCNKDALNARVRFECGGVVRQAEVLSQAGFMCGASRRLHFGLGKAKEAESVVVRWPGGEEERFGALAAGARWRLVQGTGKAERVPLHAQPALARAAADGPEFGPEHGPVPVARIVLIDRLPMAALELPRFDGTEARIANLAGAPALVALVDAGDPLSARAVDALGALGALGELGKRAGSARIAVVVQGDPARVAAARTRLAELRLEGGPADERFLAALQVFVIEVLGPFERLPLPLFLELDPAGQLVALRAGSIDVAGALADLARLAGNDARARGTTEINPGRAVAPLARDLGSVAQVFDLLGRADLARFCREQKKQRGEK